MEILALLKKKKPLAAAWTAVFYFPHKQSGPSRAAKLFLLPCRHFSTLALLSFPQSQDGAPALTLVGKSAGPCHEGQIAVLVGRIPQIGQALEACAPQQAGFPVREGVKAVAAVVRAHPAGTCQRRQEGLVSF